MRSHRLAWIGVIAWCVIAGIACGGGSDRGSREQSPTAPSPQQMPTASIQLDGNGQLKSCARAGERSDAISRKRARTPDPGCATRVRGTVRFVNEAREASRHADLGADVQPASLHRTKRSPLTSADRTSGDCDYHRRVSRSRPRGRIPPADGGAGRRSALALGGRGGRATAAPSSSRGSVGSPLQTPPNARVVHASPRRR